MSVVRFSQKNSMKYPLQTTFSQRYIPITGVSVGLNDLGEITLSNFVTSEEAGRDDFVKFARQIAARSTYLERDARFLRKLAAELIELAEWVGEGS
jgi:hypothetical protein